MPFIARRFLTDSVEDCIKPEDLAPYEKRNSFFCPGCPCEFLYRSESSNNKAAHFFKHGAHDSDCWMPVAESIKGETDWHVADGFNINDFYAMISSARTRTGAGPGTAGGGTKNPTEMHLSTLRNLYKFCCYHSNDSLINNGVAIKDILVARKTSYIYTKYLSGIKLVECRYYGYNRNNNLLHFYYPYSAQSKDDATFQISVFCSSTPLFDALLSKVYDEDNIVLLMCDWNMQRGRVRGIISNTHQLVRLC